MMGRGDAARVETLEGRTMMSAGAPDPTFGSGGRVVTQLPGMSVFVTDVAVARDGAVLVLAQGRHLPGPDGQSGPPEVVVARYHRDGSLDDAFGTDGIVSMDLNMSPAALAVRRDGKIVVAGGTAPALSGDPAVIAAQDFMVARLNADGSLDGRFGTGGVADVDVAAGRRDVATAVTVQRNGRIILAGEADTLGINGGDWAFAVARVRADGSTDTSFGTGGATVTDLGGNDVPAAVGVDGKGRIVLAGGAGGRADAPGTFAVVRYTRRGMPDAAFGENGRVLRAFDGFPAARITDLAILHGNKVLVAGEIGSGVAIPEIPAGPQGVALARYRPNGTPDATFGTAGLATTVADGVAGAVSITIQQGGRLAAVTSSGQMIVYRPRGELEFQAPVATNDFRIIPIDAAAQDRRRVVVAGFSILENGILVTRLDTSAPASKGLSDP